MFVVWAYLYYWCEGSYGYGGYTAVEHVLKLIRTLKDIWWESLSRLRPRQKASTYG